MAFVQVGKYYSYWVQRERGEDGLRRKYIKIIDKQWVQAEQWVEFVDDKHKVGRIWESNLKLFNLLECSQLKGLLKVGE